MNLQMIEIFAFIFRRDWLALRLGFSDGPDSFGE
jgi:hypothetical protein